jgi:hypothetical protein
MKYSFIAILTIFICSCKNSVDTYKLDKDSQEIYNLALDNTTGSDTIVRYHLRIPPMQPPLDNGGKVDKLERLNFQKWQDSMRTILDTTELFVVINHKIDTLYNSAITEIIETITTNKSNLDYKMNGDTSFNETLRKLCNNKLSYDTIDVLKLKTQFNYKIYSDRSYPKKEFNQIGKLRFSKIAFSYKKDKAAIYTSLMCGRLCGTGQILFFEKVKGTWKYIRTWEMWVS